MGWDSVWEEIYMRQEWGKYPAEDLVRFIAKNFYHVPLRENCNILEVGCGTGANLWYLAREGYNVYGIDGSATAIKKAIERLDLECPKWCGQLFVGDISELPFEDQFFDGVIDNEAVYCNSFEQSIMIYDSMARVCKTGGKLFSRTFASGSWGDKTGKKAGKFAYFPNVGPMKDGGFSRFTDEEQIAELLTDKFRIDNVELLSRSVEKGRYEIKEWLIQATKC